MTQTLEQVLADARGELPILRRRGAGQVADAIEDLCNQVARAAEPFITWLSETDAHLYSGRAIATLRRHFPRWLAEDKARWNPHKRRERQYLMCILPRRFDADAVRYDARETARRAS